MADMIKKTVRNTVTTTFGGYLPKLGNITFTVYGKCWNPLDGVAIPVEYTVTDCRDEMDAFGTAMDAFCGNLYDWTILQEVVK